MWKVVYLVDGDDAEIDAQYEGGLSLTDVTATLNTVTASISSTSETYGSSVYTGDVTLLYNYNSVFTLNLKTELRQTDFSQFTTLIEKAFADNLNLDLSVSVTIVDQEEVVSADKYVTTNKDFIKIKICNKCLIMAILCGTCLSVFLELWVLE